MRQINEKLASYISNDRIKCADCHRAAQDLGIDPGELSSRLDRLGCRIKGCQVGLFGHTLEQKEIDPSIDVPAILSSALTEYQKNGRISCKTCWKIADELKIRRLDIGSACEKLEIRIKPCQLGIF